MHFSTEKLTYPTVCDRIKKEVSFMEIYLAKTLWKEKKGFSLYRKNNDEYVFIHFLTPAKAVLNGKEESISPGGCVVFEAGKSRHISSPDCDLVHDWFHADLSFGKLLKKYGVECEKAYYPRGGKSITEAVHRTELEYMRKEAFYQSYCEADIEKIIIQMARSQAGYIGLSEISKETKKVFENARIKIHSEYQSFWNIEKMAALTALSPSRFAGIYKSIYGISPILDLINLRVERAKIMLSCGYSVKETAEKTGYNSQYNFIRQFKKYTGTTPGHYKK